MPAAGMYPGLLPTLVREFGSDIIVPAGGGVLGHPHGYTAGAKAWMQAVDAVMEDLPLEEAAKTRPELKVAIDHWGVLKRPHTPWSRYGSFAPGPGGACGAGCPYLTGHLP